MTLEHWLVEHIKQRGPITVAEYMAHALTHPEFGYYMHQNPFGREGDFITAPDISQVFGDLIGLWCLDRWQAMGIPNVTLIELGPGRGTLMKDILRITAASDGFHDALTVRLVEASPTLRALQAQQLTPLHKELYWHDTLDDALSESDGPVLLLANEFLDALPIHQAVRQGHHWQERYVDVGKQGFRFALSRVSSNAFTLPEPEFYPAGAMIEWSPPVAEVVERVATHLGEHPGAALWVDYGYDHPRPMGDTLQAVKSHQFQPVLAAPGTADLTAHVNFRAARAAGEVPGAQVFGPVEQGTFLRRLGVEVWATKLCFKASEEQKHDILTGLERLVSPQHMGQLFKVLAVQSADLPPPAGF